MLKPVLAAGAMLLSVSALSPAVSRECDVYADVQQCCSLSGCGGKVLNNRDRHNCKNSGGKGWHPAASNGEPAVCVKP